MESHEDSCEVCKVLNELWVFREKINDATKKIRISHGYKPWEKKGKKWKDKV
jgi:hypothetical protein